MVLQTGQALNMALPMSSNAYQLFLAAAALGEQSQEEPSVVSLYETLNDIDIAKRAAQLK